MKGLQMQILLAFLDQSIVFAINGNISSDLNAVGSSSWIATAYDYVLLPRKTVSDSSPGISSP